MKGDLSFRMPDCIPDNSLQPDLGMSPQTILLRNYFKG